MTEANCGIGVTETPSVSIFYQEATGNVAVKKDLSQVAAKNWMNWWVWWINEWIYLNRWIRCNSVDKSMESSQPIDQSINQINQSDNRFVFGHCFQDVISDIKLKEGNYQLLLQTCCTSDEIVCTSQVSNANYRSKYLVFTETWIPWTSFNQSCLCLHPPCS